MVLRAIILVSWLMAAAPDAAAAPPDSIPEAWKQTWRAFEVDPAIAESIVWPEMQRYSYLYDVLETSVNSFTCSSEWVGKDFSIGIFQMKPSFVEQLEQAWHSLGFADFYNLRFDAGGSAASRRARIDRLSVREWQVIYLGMFLHMLYYSYGLEALPVEEQVRVAANAYNRGCAWPDAGSGSIDALRVGIDAELFHYDNYPFVGPRRYCYSALALEHYKAITE